MTFTSNNSSNSSHEEHFNGEKSSPFCDVVTRRVFFRVSTFAQRQSKGIWEPPKTYGHLPAASTSWFLFLYDTSPQGSVLTRRADCSFSTNTNRGAITLQHCPLSSAPARERNLEDLLNTLPGWDAQGNPLQPLCHHHIQSHWTLRMDLTRYIYFFYSFSNVSILM